MKAGLQALTRSRRWMAAGLLFSVFGGLVGEGVIPGAVAVGALAVAWIPIFTTVETLEDLFSVAAARVIERYDAGRVLIFAELFVGAGAVGALVAIWAGAPQFPVFVCFALITSIVPLIIDIAEEIYAGEVAKQDRDSALKFNIAIYTVIGLVGTLLARPLGAALVSVGVPIVLILTVASSILALLCRLYSIRSFSSIAGTTSLKGDLELEDDERGRKVPWQAAISTRTPGGPLISMLSGAAGAMLSTYAAIWLVKDLANENVTLAIVFICIGLGATLGPLGVRHAGKIGNASSLRILFALRLIATLGIGAVALLTDPGAWRLSAGTACLTALAAGTAATAVVQATARQTEYRDEGLSQIVGWAHSAAALGILIGVWVGLILGVSEMPLIGSVVAAGLIASSALLIQTPSSRED